MTLALAADLRHMPAMPKRRAGRPDLVTEIALARSEPFTVADIVAAVTSALDALDVEQDRRGPVTRDVLNRRVADGLLEMCGRGRYQRKGLASGG